MRRALALVWLGACSSQGPGLFDWCVDPTPGPPVVDAPTYHQELRPIVDGKCARCHQPGGIAPFSLGSFDELYARRDASLAAVMERRMPPWQADSCCASYRHDWSLTEEERALFSAWVRTGARQGDPAAPPTRPTPVVGGLSRVDVRLAMAEPYTPQPPAGSTDDVRCFLLDWPVDHDVYVTGINVLPGNRSIVHHLIVGVVSGGDVGKAVERDRKDPGPGFACAGGIGGIKVSAVLGGGLAASELPEGFGTKVSPGSKILLNVHYSTAHTPQPGGDRTTLEVQTAGSGKQMKSMIVMNVAWMIGDAMRVRKGDPDAVYYYRFRPTLFTGGKPVRIYAAHPHMHYLGSKFLLGILREDGTQDCLLSIPRWQFGWEQPYFLDPPKRLGRKDQVYVECHFDNSAGTRDIAWGGNNQDMCVGFLMFAPE